MKIWIRQNPFWICSACQWLVCPTPQWCILIESKELTGFLLRFLAIDVDQLDSLLNSNNLCQLKKSFTIFKMRPLLLFVMLCVASASCVELENLCSSDTFKHEGVLVNAFHRVQWNVTLEPPSHYLVPGTVKCDFREFKNKTNFWQALKLKYE